MDERLGDKKYLSILRACEQDLANHGDNYRGMGWTKQPEDADRRYQVMLDVIRRPSAGPVSLLDVGCGTSLLYEYMQRGGVLGIDYSGLDLSIQHLALARSKFPSITYYQVDLLDGTDDVPEFDYLIINGIFTSKPSLSFDEMWLFFQAFIERAFTRARIGMAFNVTTKLVDWERDDLFHLPFDQLGLFLSQKISRNFLIRHDYGLYEYTTYVYR